MRNNFELSNKLFGVKYVGGHTAFYEKREFHNKKKKKNWPTHDLPLNHDHIYFFV